MSPPPTVYLDYNATTPVDPRVLEQMLPYFNSKFGNSASKNHRFGWEAEEAVEVAREQVASLIGAKPKEIVFTSGATESNNLALKGTIDLRNEGHFVSCATEHKAVLDPISELLGQGVSSSILPVDKEGILLMDQLEQGINPATNLVSVMLANNETGVIQPVREIAEIARKSGSLFMTDATQAAGKVPVDVDALGIDLMSFSGHKMYGPKGVGVLYVRGNSKVKIKAQLNGGGHERGMRSGTLNIPGIVGMGMACEICKEEMKEEASRLGSLRDNLENGLLKLPSTSRNGAIEGRLSHVSNISFEGLEGQQLILGLNDIAVSLGSACTSAIVEPSHVLKAMGISDVLAMSSLRFSLGRFTTEEEIDFTIRRVTEVVSQLRN